ncbi:hypothetical protein Q0N12_02740 [Rossellomorea marisflavi]|uniref:Uncharacterized protein n=1 Tax=Rossellomorea marisflavi TaxID=189381 RepID=A0A0M0GS28_9BACI|nr:hypothetical protein [Rossellomorea marisflavi]KON92659.1 hypothetical protein AF331_04575 [Rossellomorea marisflavi]MDW4526883.1 hypothetical protein [Rossellomorea marisflavi]
MSNQGKMQLNVRIDPETSEKLDEIVEYYQENTKIGRVYKGDVLTDIILKSYDVMQKQKAIQKRKY